MITFTKKKLLEMGLSDNDAEIILQCMKLLDIGVTSEEKRLLYEDLSARVPYKVKLLNLRSRKIEVIYSVENGEYCLSWYNNSCPSRSFLEDYRPYLRSLSTITNKERFEFQEILGKDVEISAVLDYLIAHHFDVRRLIPKGLAIEAPENMYDNTWVAENEKVTLQELIDYKKQYEESKRNLN